MNTYMSGTLVQSSATFLNASGVAADPTTITLKYKLGPGIVETVVYPTAPINRVSAGVYTANFDTTGWSGPGNRLDLMEWIGTGTVQAINTDNWEVEPPLL
jgi:hypothetical protein